MTTVWSKAIRSRVILANVSVLERKAMGICTYTDTVVPERNIVLLPLEMCMNLLSSGDEFVEIIDDCIRLGFGNADDSSDKARVEKYRLPPSDRVRADNWMFGYDWFATDRTTEGIRTISLDLGRMQSFKSFEILLHAR